MRWVVLFCTYLLSNNVYAEKYIVGAQNLAYFPHYDFASTVDKGAAWSILEAFSKASGHEFIYVSLPIRRLQLDQSITTQFHFFGDSINSKISVGLIRSLPRKINR